MLCSGRTGKDGSEPAFISMLKHKVGPESTQPVAVITLRPTQTRKQERKKVVWTEDTIDNEDMNKKKSKCCCIYEKPHKFGESDSEESDDECEHCQGHVEKKKHKHDQPSTSTEARSAQPAEPPVSLPLRPPHPPDGPSTS